MLQNKIMDLPFKISRSTLQEQQIMREAAINWHRFVCRMFVSELHNWYIFTLVSCSEKLLTAFTIPPVDHPQTPR